MRNNAGLADAAGVADRSFRDIRDHVAKLNARGAHITVEGVLALLVFETEARVTYYNDRCEQNSFFKKARCWSIPKARYSYQYGLGAIHTSLFNPCNPNPATRRRMNDLLREHRFVPTAADIDSVRPELRRVCAISACTRGVCAKTEPDAVDYYILKAHEKFEIPPNSESEKKNVPPTAAPFPFFSPEISIDLFFTEIGSKPQQLPDDRAMIVAFGSGDAYYRNKKHQSAMLGKYTSYSKANCH